MTENLKGKMGHKINHFNVGKGHPIEEVKIILHCINFNIPCHKALKACTLKNIPFSTLFSAHTFLQRNRSLWVTTPPPRSLSSWKTIESDFTEKSDPINFPEPIKNRTRIVMKSGPNNLNRTRFHNNSSTITIWNRARLLQFGSDLSSRVRGIIRVRLENMGPGIPENDKHQISQNYSFWFFSEVFILRDKQQEVPVTKQDMI